MIKFSDEIVFDTNVYKNTQICVILQSTMKNEEIKQQITVPGF
jgi:hypothetical protein